MAESYKIGLARLEKVYRTFFLYDSNFLRPAYRNRDDNIF